MGIKIKITKRRLLGLLGLAGGGGYFFNNQTENTGSGNTSPPDFWGETQTIASNRTPEPIQFTIEREGPTIFNITTEAAGEYIVRLRNIKEGTQYTLHSGNSSVEKEIIVATTPAEHILTTQGNISKYSIKMQDYHRVDRENDVVGTPPIKTNSENGSIFGPIYFTPQKETVFEFQTSGAGSYKITGYDESGQYVYTILNENTDSKNTIRKTYQLNGIGYFRVVANNDWSVSITKGNDLTKTQNETNNKSQKEIQEERKQPEVTISNKSLTVNNTKATITADVTNNTKEELEQIFLRAKVYNNTNDTIGEKFKILPDTKPKETVSTVIDVQLSNPDAVNGFDLIIIDEEQVTTEPANGS